MIERIDLEDCVLEAANIIYVGLSGGLDSVVLLHVLSMAPDLKAKLRAIHIHHGLSPNAGRWQVFCEQYAARLGVPCQSYSVQIDATSNLEAHARRHRYAIFKSLLQAGDVLALAHHQDDQAETFLLQLLRGAGVLGLGAMQSVKPFAQGHLVRPLLSRSREQLLDYAKAHQLQWVTDESNEDIGFSRNFIRHQVLPVLQSRWTAANKTIARAAGHCQDAQTLLQRLATMDAGEDLSSSHLAYEHLLSSDWPTLKNILRTWLWHNHCPMPDDAILERLISEVMFADVDATPVVFFGANAIRRYQGVLYITPRALPSWPSGVWSTFPEPHPLPGVGEIRAIEQREEGVYLHPSMPVEIHFRQGGECFYYNGHTHALKKLMQTWHIPPWERASVPLIVQNGVVVAVLTARGVFYRTDKGADRTSKKRRYGFEFILHAPPAYSSLSGNC